MGISWKRRLSIAVLAGGLALAACGNDDDSDALPDVEAEDTTTTTTEPDENGPPDDEVQPNEPLDDNELPGEEFDLFPHAGAEMTVAGVAADDVLNIRAGPGPEFDILTSLAPLSDGDAVATGRNRIVESGIWAEVSIGPITGWGNTRFLFQSADTVDDTSRLYPTPDDRPFVPAGDDPAGALAELGMIVAEEYASDGEPESTFTVVDGPHLSEMSDVTIDVLGLGDDSTGGYRVHVFSDADHEGYGVYSVETTPLCLRGVSDGVCL